MKLLRFLPCLFAAALGLQAQTTPIVFSAVNLGTSINNATIHIYPDQTDGTPLWIGTNLVQTQPFDIYLVNGTVTTNLAPWGFSFELDGWPRPVHVAAWTPTTNATSVTSLINTNSFSPLNLVINALKSGTNIVLVTNVDQSVSINTSIGVFTNSSFYVDPTGNLFLGWKPGYGWAGLINTNGDFTTPGADFFASGGGNLGDNLVNWWPSGDFEVSNILQASALYIGPTSSVDNTNLQPRFSLTVASNAWFGGGVTVTGAVSAASFAGNGAGLTNLNPNAVTGPVGGETLGQKLRRLMSAAKLSNPDALPALTCSPGWNTNTPYYGGNIVSNMGSLFICYSTGVSSNAYPGPTNIQSAPISDGSNISWYYYGPANPVQNAIGAPTIYITNNTPPQDSNYVYFFFNPSHFFISGGLTNLAFSWGPINIQAADSGNGNSGNNGASITWYTDDPLPCILGYGAGPYQVIVDDQFAFNGGGHQVSYTPNCYTVVNFNGVRRPHKITFCQRASAFYTGVAISGYGSVWAPNTADHIRAGIFGDSITAGGNGLPLIDTDYWFRQLCHLLGIDDPWLMANGGTGYIATNGTATNFIGNVSILTNHFDILFVFGGINDPTNGLQAAVTNFLIAARSYQPTTPIIVLGCYPAATGPSTISTNKELQIEAGVASMNDANMWFVPVTTDTNGSWITGTGDVVSPTGNGNSDVETGSDDTHPVENAEFYLARRAYSAVAAIIDKIK